MINKEDSFQIEIEWMKEILADKETEIKKLEERLELIELEYKDRIGNLKSEIQNIKDRIDVLKNEK